MPELPVFNGGQCLLLLPQGNLDNRAIGHGKVVSDLPGYMVQIDQITPPYPEKAVCLFKKFSYLCECAEK